MGYLNITNIEFKQGNGSIRESLLLEVKFDCLKDINNEICWRLIYVADPDEDKHDQILDEIFMDKLEYGVNNFDWEVSPPDYSKLSNPYDVFDTTILMVIVLIEGREFFRCSYLVTHEYDNEEMRDNPPDQIDLDKLVRKIKTDNPVITIKEIAWEELKNHAGTNNPQLITETSDPRFQGFDILASNK